MAERLVDVGRQLREARQQRGEDLYDVADYLRIKPSYLFALEEGDASGMPGRTYAMGFLRSYADHLGFDGSEVVRRLKSAAAADAEQHLKVREPVADTRRPSLAMMVAALLLAVVAYGGWHVLQAEGENALDRIAALPGEIGQYASTFFDDAAVEVGHAETDEGSEAARSAVASRAVEPATRTAALPRLEASPSRTSSPSESPAQSTSTPAGSTPAATTSEPAASATAATVAAGPTGATSAPAGSTAAPPAADEATAAVGETVDDGLASLELDAEAERAAALARLDSQRPDGGTAAELLAGLQLTTDSAADEPDAAPAEPVVSDTGRVVLLAREASWIQVQSPARDYITSRTLEPGDRFVIPDRNDLALWTGNAGGLEIWVDGRNVGILGQSGAVMRDIPLVPEALLAMRR